MRILRSTLSPRSFPRRLGLSFTAMCKETLLSQSSTNYQSLAWSLFCRLDYILLCSGGGSHCTDLQNHAAENVGESGFAHMARMATEARSAVVERWIVDHVDRRRRYKPPKGQKPRRSSLISAGPFEGRSDGRLPVQ